MAAVSDMRPLERGGVGGECGREKEGGRERERVEANERCEGEKEKGVRKRCI